MSKKEVSYSYELSHLAEALGVQPATARLRCRAAKISKAPDGSYKWTKETFEKDLAKIKASYKDTGDKKPAPKKAAPKKAEKKKVATKKPAPKKPVAKKVATKKVAPKAKSSSSDQAEGAASTA